MTWQRVEFPDKLRLSFQVLKHEDPELHDFLCRNAPYRGMSKMIRDLLSAAAKASQGNVGAPEGGRNRPGRVRAETAASPAPQEKPKPAVPAEVKQESAGSSWLEAGPVAPIPAVAVALPAVKEAPPGGDVASDSIVAATANIMATMDANY